MTQLFPPSHPASGAARRGRNVGLILQHRMARLAAISRPRAMDRKRAGLTAPAFRGQAPERRRDNHFFTSMNNPSSTKKRHRISVDAEPGFEAKVRLLSKNGE